jgi:hypothetical protein
MSVCLYYLPWLPGVHITSFLHRILLPFVACLAVPFCPHYLKNGTVFEGRITEHKMF